MEEIIRRLDSGEASLNETLELVQEGKALIELCAQELEAVAARCRSCASTSWSPGSSASARPTPRPPRRHRGNDGEHLGAPR